MPTKKKELITEQPPRLLVVRPEAEAKINTQIEKGRVLLGPNVITQAEVEELKSGYNKWNDFNKELLRVLFSGERIITDYDRHRNVSFTMNGGVRETIRVNKELITRGIQELESIIERLDLIPESQPSVLLPQEKPHDKIPNKNIFIVHGHDSGMKQTVARFVEKLGFTPIILHEQANQGRTIIEKFEANADVCFAIILLTPDDIGGETGKDVNQSRARQNVILELGYFIGTLGRKNVCALYVEGVELPSDLSGILYISFDGGEAWKFKLAKEIRASGIEIDLNLVI